MLSEKLLGAVGNASNPLYVEDVFSTYLYNGNGTVNSVPNGIASVTTVAWSGNQLYYPSVTTSQCGIYGLAVDSSGNFYTSGYAYNGSTYFIFVNKYSSSGVLQWQREVAQGNSRGYGVAVDSSGNVYVSGYATNTANYLALFKYNSSGTLQWQRYLKDTGSFTGTARVALDSSGNPHIIGYGNVTSTTYRYLLVAKYDTTGAIQWQRKITRSYSSDGQDIAIDSSNNVYVTGMANNTSANPQLVLSKFDSSGTFQWSRTLIDTGATTVLSNGYGVAVDTSGNAFVVGSGRDSGTASQPRALIAKYDASGTLLWQKKFNTSTQNMQANCCTTDSSGNLYVGGENGTANNGFIAKYNSSGVLQWQRATAQGNVNAITRIVADNSGNLYATGIKGEGATGATYTPFTIKIAQDGTTTSGYASVEMFTTTYTSADGIWTSSSYGTSATSAATDSAGGASDSAGTATVTSFTQPATTGADSLVWLKDRSDTSVVGGAFNNALYDTVRGTNRYISSDTSSGSTIVSDTLTNFTANGFTLGSSGSTVSVNDAADIYASWQFKEQSKFFDIVTYTGNGTSQNISHSLGSVPGCMMIKRTDATGGGWRVYHRSLSSPASSYLILNATNAQSTAGADTTVWNNTSPTSSVFSVGANTLTNANGVTYVAYLFAHNAGGFGLTGTDNVISCGSYTMSSGAATVNLGYEPQYILSKVSSTTGNWEIYDTVRGMPNPTTGAPVLNANATSAETSGGVIYPKSTGFYHQTGGSGTYVYIAIRRGPMKTPTDGTKVYQPVVYTGTGANNRLINTNILADSVWIRLGDATTIDGMVVGSRVTGQPYSLTNSSATPLDSATAFDQQKVSTTEYGTAFSSMNGVWVGTDAAALLNASTGSNNQIIETFQRAPGFHDVVVYTGTGTNTTITHNLGVAPELIIVKKTSASGNWPVYHASLGNTKYILVNSTAGAVTDSTYWNNTSPTSSVFSVGTSSNTNGSGSTYVAYLFATLSGVSKVGTYTGNGSSQTINCGFGASGARFVLIKELANANWVVFDSARGLTSTSSPYIALSNMGVEATGNNGCYAASTGFTVTSASGFNYNASTYIYLAIA